jgi:hypothetical protein
MDNLTLRAIRAYERAADGPRDGYGWPYGLPIPANDSGPVNAGGHDYVVLRNVNGVLAIYRVRNSGALKRLKRLPAGLQEAWA